MEEQFASKKDTDIGTSLSLMDSLLKNFMHSMVQEDCIIHFEMER